MTGQIHVKNNRILGYSVYGDLGGKPLFYFHGWPASRMSAEIYDTLAKKLHVKIIASDRPGYGLSDYQQGRALLDWPDDVAALADHLHIKKFAVMGVSGGGPYAAACAFKIPGRITKTGIVVGLAPIIGPESLDGVMWTAKIGWANFGKYWIVRRISVVTQYMNTFYGFYKVLHHYLFGAKTDRAVYRDPSIERSVMKNYREAFRQGIIGPELDLQLYTTDWHFPVSEITTKTYLWYGEADRNVSLNMGTYYAKVIRGSILKTYPHEGHVVSITHAKEILTTLTS